MGYSSNTDFLQTIMCTCLHSAYFLLFLVANDVMPVISSLDIDCAKATRHQSLPYVLLPETGGVIMD